MSLKNRREGQERGYLSPHGGFGDTKSYGRKRRSLAAPIIIACAVVAVLVAADYLMNTDKIYRGVEVGDVPLGGSSPAEAEEIVKERVTGALEEIEFSGPEHFTRTAGEMGVSFNVQATVDEAYAVGREGNILERLGERARALVIGVTIPPDVDYSPEKVRAEVGEIASRANHEPQDAYVNVYGSHVEVVESRKGYRLDNAGTAESVDGAIEDMSGQARLVGEVLEPAITTAEAQSAAEKARRAVSEQLVFKAEGKSWTLSPADIGSALDVTRSDGEIDVVLNEERLKNRLAHVYGDLTVTPVEASYDFGANGGVIVMPSKDGQNIDDDKFIGSIKEGLFEDKREYQVPIVVDKPTYTTAELEAMKPTTLQGSYQTNYTLSSDTSEERVQNLKLASGEVSGTFVAPGEIFSMNDTVSDVSYKRTHVIINGKETLADGGGLCQVTSTLYNAVLFAGLEVVERHPHASQLPYIRPGMDATIWFGALDMKFKNTTDGYILLEEYVSDDGYVYANVYGVPDNVNVEMSSEKLWMTDDASEWVTYYKRTDGGEVVYEDRWKTEYDALIDDKGKKIKTPDVNVEPVLGGSA
ncbi:MAG TPA: VanW family protein [Rubrobacteraceae bacterium]|nr:VanW family protein [Rubrobacteraceae bacterium]